MSAKKLAELSQSPRVYDGASNQWVTLQHPLYCGCPACALQVLMEDAGGVFRQRRDAWKTLVRFVWHNAQSMRQACGFFGLAALHIDLRYGGRMRDVERAALATGSTAVFDAVFDLDTQAVYRTLPPLGGYTPMAALLLGEDEPVGAAERSERQRALAAIFHCAWKDLRTRKWTRSLKSAFANFTVITAEDRDLVAWVTQTEFAEGFLETRAAMSARRRRKVRVTLELNGCRGLTAPGGKSESAIASYALAQRGNRNRSGAASRAADDMGEIPVRLPVPLKDLEAHYAALAKAAEVRRLVKLFGPEMAGCDPALAVPRSDD